MEKIAIGQNILWVWKLEILKRATLKYPCKKNSVVESIFIQTAVTDSRPATLLKILLFKPF